MQIKYTENGSTVDVQFIGELDTPAAAEIQQTIDKLMEFSAKEIVIDCSQLSYIASTGLRQLISIHKQCKAAGGHMRLVNVTPETMEIFAVTRFDKVFDIA